MVVSPVGPAGASQLHLQEPSLDLTWPFPGGAPGSLLTGKSQKANLPVLFEVKYGSLTSMCPGIHVVQDHPGWGASEKPQLFPVQLMLPSGPTSLMLLLQAHFFTHLPHILCQTCDASALDCPSPVQAEDPPDHSPPPPSASSQTGRNLAPTCPIRQNLLI